MAEIFFWEAVRDAIREEMLRDERVFVMGEDVAIYGGAYGATRGLWEEFGDERVRDTAISEAAIAGAATGAAMLGMRPVAEIMHADFLTIAMDQLVNTAAKNRYMFGGRTKVPMVLRTEGGAGRGIAAQHSQSLEAWFNHVPGLYLVMPSTPYDAKGLLKTCIRDENPTLFIEHKMLYGMKGEVPEEEYTIPLKSADIKRAGKDVTIIAYSRMVHEALAAAQLLAEQGIESEVIDPRTIKPLDTDTIYKSVKKTGKVCCVSEGCRTNGVPCDFISLIQENVFDYLDGPIKRVCTEDVPIPMSPVLEAAALPNAEKIKDAVMELF